MLLKPSQQAYLPGETIYAAMADYQKEQVDAWHAALAAGTFVPTEPRLAATVMLVRRVDADHVSEWRSTAAPADRMAPPNGIEVFMIRRQRTMAVAPNAAVFPGGRVDLRDSDTGIPWLGAGPAEWAHRIGRDEETARRVVVCAIRETFEESGVLLARAADGSDAPLDTSGDAWLEERRLLVEHEVAFAEVLRRHGLAIDTDRLRYLANWCTPEYAQRRHDTFFFVAECPAGQDADDKTREAFLADWLEPQWAFDRADAGLLDLMAPTVYNLGFAARAANMDELLGTEHVPYRFMEKPVILPDGTYAFTGVLPA